MKRDGPDGVESSGVASITETNAFEAGLRKDAEITAEDEALALRLLNQAAWTNAVPRTAETTPGHRTRTFVGFAAAAAVLLLSTGFASARLIDWVQALGETRLQLPISPSQKPSPRPLAAPPPKPQDLVMPEWEPASPPAEAPLVAAPQDWQSKATALFRAANTARAQQRPQVAAALYARLARLYPQAPEARLCHVSLGRLWLDDGKPAPALRAFDAYLRQDAKGPLAHEALAGRALALQALGRPQQEAQAWRALLQQHPDTLLKTRARLRLAALADAKGR